MARRQQKNWSADSGSCNEPNIVAWDGQGDSTTHETCFWSATTTTSAFLLQVAVLSMTIAEFPERPNRLGRLWEGHFEVSLCILRPIDAIDSQRRLSINASSSSPQQVHQYIEFINTANHHLPKTPRSSVTGTIGYKLTRAVMTPPVDEFICKC